MRLSSALRILASAIIFFFGGWLAFAGGAYAQTKGAAPPSEAERMMRGLTGESDADFDALLMSTASVLGKLANVYAAQNDIARASKLSERAVRLAGDGIDPGGAWVFYNHALLAWRAQRYDEASNFFHRGADLSLGFMAIAAGKAPMAWIRSAVSPC